MKRARTLVAWALAACGAAALPVHADPVLDWGLSAFVALDAGDAHWFDNFVEWGTVTSSPLFDHAVSDGVGGGAQAAQTTAYARIGSLGGKVLASCSSGYILSAGQGSDDLQWVTDLLVTGTPGTPVSFLFATQLDGVFTTGGSHAGGGVGATTYVAGIPLADWHLDSIANPGPFNRSASAVYTFDVGTVVRLSSRLTVMARAEQDNAVAETNALDTSAFFVDVLTPGGGYVTGGGVVFANVPAVPEPASALLFALGAALLAGAVGSKASAVSPQRSPLAA